MIIIEERTPDQVSGVSSLFLTFNYNPKVIEIIKSTELYCYNEKNRTWELPIVSLAYLLDNLTFVDDITLKLKRNGLDIVCSHPVNEYPDWVIQAIINLYKD